MKKRFLTTLLLIPLFAVAAGQAEDKHSHVEWSYDGKTGPSHWSELSSSYHLCRSGRRQSPIDLRVDSAIPATGLPLSISYKPDTVDEVNNGHTVKEIIHNESKVKYDGREYRLAQFHFHSHSEHTLDGKPLPLEIHFVHQDEDGNLLVIGVLFQEGAANPSLEPLLRHLPSHTGDHEVDLREKINLAELIPTNSAAFSYDGSLTTPPASEGVRWFVFQKPLTLSKQQLAKLRSLYDHNYRPVQPLNGRLLSLFRQRAERRAK